MLILNVALGLKNAFICIAFKMQKSVEVLVNVTPVECDENSLNVSWKVNDELLKSQNHWTIQVSSHLQLSCHFKPILCL